MTDNEARDNASTEIEWASFVHDWGAKTIKSYNSSYKRFLGLSRGKQIHQLSEVAIIKILAGDPHMNLESKCQILNLIVKVREAYGLGAEDVRKYRNEKVAPLRTIYRKKQNKQLSDKLPSIAQIESYLRRLLREGRCKEYIVNALLLKFGFRNMDMNLVLAKRSKQAQSKKSLDYDYGAYTGNWLFVYDSGRHIDLIINEYKTVSTYGPKHIKFRSETIARCARSILGDDQKKPLILNSDGSVPPKESALEQIRNMTYDGLGEGTIFKAIVYDLVKQGKLKEVEKLSKTRGTSMATITDVYYTGED